MMRGGMMRGGSAGKLYDGGNGGKCGRYSTFLAVVPDPFNVVPEASPSFCRFALLSKFGVKYTQSLQSFRRFGVGVLDPDAAGIALRMHVLYRVC